MSAKLKPRLRLLCRLFGHNWLHARGFSTNKPMRHCVRCGKQEFV